MVAEGIKAAHTCLTKLKTILLPSFGPWGKDVLMKSNTGTIYITKNGSSIIKQLQMKHPIGSIIQKSINNYFEVTGDFTKSFIIVLCHLVDILFQKFINVKSHQRVEELQMLLSMISRNITKTSRLFSYENIIMYLKGKMIQCTSAELFEKYFDGLFQVFICNQYNKNTCIQIKKFIQEIFQIVGISKENIEYLVRHFNSICVQVHGLPLDFSKIVHGAIIQRESTPRDVEMKMCRFLVLSGELSRVGKGINLMLNEDSILHQELSLQKFYSVFIEQLVSQDITLIFTEEVIPKHLQLLLTENNITYVSFVQKEDLDRLCLVYNISILSGLYDIHSIKDTQNVVGVATFFKSCVLGTKYCCHLGPQNTENKISNIQLLLCSTTEGIGIQYVETVHSFLKVLYQCFDEETSCSIFPAGGAFELILCDYFYNLKLLKTNDMEHEIVEIIADSLLEIPKAIFNNSGQLTTKRFLFNLKKIKTKTLSVNETSQDINSDLFYTINGTSGSIMNMNPENLYEPLNSKMILVAKVLELCAQIVRIDSIVPVSRKDYLFSDNISEDANDE